MEILMQNRKNNDIGQNYINNRLIEPMPIMAHKAEDFDHLSIPDAIQLFNHMHNFENFPDNRPPKFIGVYTGCLIVPLPNVEVRPKYIKFHDLHHIMTGYSVGRIGEGQVSAWELGTGSAYKSLLLGFMNLIAISTGFFLKPKAIWHAYVRGTQSRNMYWNSQRQAIQNNDYLNITELKKINLEYQKPNLWLGIRVVEFAVYILLAMIVHFILVIPALILRVIVDIGLKKPLILMIKPPKRPDLY